MTKEQRAQLESAFSGYGEQGANSYDLSMFRENLRRTRTARKQRLQAAVDFFQEETKSVVANFEKVEGLAYCREGDVIRCPQ